MKQWGAPAEVIAQWEQSQVTQGEIEVLACNELTVSVFQVCQLTYMVGMGGSACMGLPMTEIRAGLTCLRVPRAEWPEVSVGLVLMGRVCARRR